jgi:uracil-DNA glycosylase
MAKNSPKAQYAGIMAESSRQKTLDRHVAQLLRCRRCSRMKSTPVSGGAIVSDVMIIGQAPGPREPVLQRPFAHTAGKTLFRWFEEFCGMNEAAVRIEDLFRRRLPLFSRKKFWRHRSRSGSGRNSQLRFLDG